ncbi:alpha/beta-hydrolase [Coprinellus micaceus]|uniref:Carboxylic ester hydrolase n=1 Tax=Coprinellus micaceus TaxID=71717 RepID=A0A4Y7TQR7_COPMI|nr:alpha/beta-hydrolase [Coprinellus micaceus]
MCVFRLMLTVPTTNRWVLILYIGGGSGYSGSTQCDVGTVCVKLNDWYSQCQPGQAPTQAPTSTISTTVSTGPTTTSTATSTATAPATSIPAGALTRLTANFGTNPTNVAIYVYKPANVKNNPALLLALHGCGGTAQQFYSATQYKQFADQRGFLILYGSAANDMNCWDNTGANSLKHDGGSDSLALASAIRYAISEWGVDANRVFVTGMSSGAMMTNTMAGAYPDLIKAGASFAGVAMGCLKASLTPPEGWADIVHRAYPGYTGPYPRMQIWHGTADPAVNYTNLNEQVKQWTQVHSISQTVTGSASGTPKSNWSKRVYGTGQVEAYTGQGSGHGLPEAGTEIGAIEFFGL